MHELQSSLLDLSMGSRIHEYLSQPFMLLNEPDHILLFVFIINELKFNLPDLYYWVDVVRATEKRLKEKNT